ncbi:MAG: DUF3108 domain-containing protein [Hyphomicrobiales bacterium]
MREQARRALPALLLALAAAAAPALLGRAAPSPGRADTTAATAAAGSTAAAPAPPARAAVSDSADTPNAGAFTPWVDPDEARRFAKVPWRLGEYFQFSIDWNGLNGGSSLMQVQNLTMVDGHRVYRIVTKTESNSFVSKFYKVRDRAESYIDAESLTTRRFIKHLREGGYKKDLDVRFDQEDHKAVYADGDTVDVPAAVHDVLSAFYYVRTRPLPDGAVIRVPTHDNKTSYDMEVHVRGRERIEVPAGKFDCVKVEPVLQSEGVFKSKGGLMVWLSDDERRIPVLVRSKIPIGSISVSLTDLRLAFTPRR